MTEVNKKRIVLALLNASEYIRSHVEVGIDPEDVDEEDEKGLREYEVICHKVAVMIEKLADKYRKL